ncbi:MAG: G2/M-phase specific E3 ubiquitin protein ligase, partial [Marteilia pararefringens]
QQSLTSGKHQFKCPLCFNVDEFHKECLQFGCYIPDRDVKWSTYSNQELANSHNDESVDNSDQSMEETLEKQDSDCKLLSLASSKDFDQSNSPDLYASELLRLLDMDQLHHNMNLNLILKDSSLDNFDVVDQRPSKEKKTRFICNSFEDCFCSIDSRKYQECCNDHKTSTISNNHSCTTNNDNEEFELPDIPQ